MKKKISNKPRKPVLSAGTIAPIVDHSLLDAGATVRRVKKLCSEAERFGFFAACVNPCRVKLAKKLLSGSGVKVCSVAGFPLGANSCASKVFEAKEAVKNGADEIDAVINIGALKSGDFDFIRKEIRELRKAVKGKVLKIIIETALLTKKEILKTSAIAAECGADFVKTSTGFGPRGASVSDIKLILKAVGGKAAIKASGGIRTTGTARKLILAGASRIGSSAFGRIMNDIRRNG